MWQKTTKPVKHLPSYSASCSFECFTSLWWYVIRALLFHHLIQLLTQSICSASLLPHSASLRNHHKAHRPQHKVHVSEIQELASPWTGLNTQAAAVSMPRLGELIETAVLQDPVGPKWQSALVWGHLNALCLFLSALAVGNMKPGP